MEKYTFREVIERIKPGESYVVTDKMWKLKGVNMNEDGDIKLLFSDGVRCIGIDSKKQFFILEEEKKERRIYEVEYIVGAEPILCRSKEELYTGDFVIYRNLLYDNKLYGRIKKVKKINLSDEEYNKYRECVEA